MDFTEVVARRRMVRRYRDQPIDDDFLQRALTYATRAPSAGFTQGWSFLVLRTRADVNRFWEATSPQRSSRSSAGSSPDSGSNAWLDGMKTAPVVIVVFASAAAYGNRYSETDKASATTRAAEMPWWQIDAGMAALLILQTATDEGLGACFFGIPADGVEGMREAFGVPDEFAAIGAITLGYPDGDPGTGSPLRRARRPLTDVAHEGNWGQQFTPLSDSLGDSLGDNERR